MSLCKVKESLRKHGLDVELLSKSPVIANLTKVDRAIYVCKDGQGRIGLISVPETAWRFEGTVFFENGFMILIDKKVALDWGI